MKILDSEKDKNIIIVSDKELKEFQNLQDENHLVLNKYKLKLLNQIANENNKDANHNIRDKFYNCDVIGCCNCSRRGVCWSISIAKEILE